MVLLRRWVGCQNADVISIGEETGAEYRAITPPGDVRYCRLRCLNNSQWMSIKLLLLPLQLPIGSEIAYMRALFFFFLFFTD